jgi:hypothetical protein
MQQTGQSQTENAAERSAMSQQVGFQKAMTTVGQTSWQVEVPAQHFHVYEHVY